jgi:hypothetical protein
MTIPPQAAIEISTTSEQMPNWQQLPPGQAPSITMNGAPFAQLPEPSLPNGWQVVVLNSTGDLTSPDNLLLNTYVFLQNNEGEWGSTYEYMYAQIINAVLNAGNFEEQILLLASFGLDADMPPSNDALQFLLDRGAGPALQDWENNSDSGSQSGGYVSTPSSYILVGNLGYPYGGGTETYITNNGQPAPASVSVTLNNNVPPT